MAIDILFNSRWHEADDPTGWADIDNDIIACTPGPGKLGIDFKDDPAVDWGVAVASRALKLTSISAAIVIQQIKALADDAALISDELACPIQAGTFAYVNLGLYPFWNAIDIILMGGTSITTNNRLAVVSLLTNNNRSSTGGNGNWSCQTRTDGGVNKSINLHTLLGQLRGSGNVSSVAPLEIMFYIPRTTTILGTAYWEIEVWLRLGQVGGLLGQNWIHVATHRKNTAQTVCFPYLTVRELPTAVGGGTNYTDSAVHLVRDIVVGTESIDADGYGEEWDPALVSQCRLTAMGRVVATTGATDDPTVTSQGKIHTVIGYIPSMGRFWSIQNDGRGEGADLDCIRFYNTDQASVRNWDEVRPDDDVLFPGVFGTGDGDYEWVSVSGVSNGLTIVAVGTKVILNGLSSGDYSMHYRRSTDGGDTWGAITEMVSTESALFNAPRPGIVLSDGRMVVPYSSATYTKLAVSSDQGVTWASIDTGLGTTAEPIIAETPDGGAFLVSRVASTYYVKYAKCDDVSDLATWGSLLEADGLSGRPWLVSNAQPMALKRFGSKLYLVWPQSDAGRSRLVIYESSDSGTTWTEVPVYGVLHDGPGTWSHPDMIRVGNDAWFHGEGGSAGWQCLALRIPWFFGPHGVNVGPWMPGLGMGAIQ